MLDTGQTLILEKLISGGGGYCSTTGSIPKITCLQNNITTEYTIAHELGHLFIWRSGGQITGSNSLFDQLQSSGSVNDRHPTEHSVVFGIVIDRTGRDNRDWRRGTSGWGSAAVTPWACDGSSGTVPYNFQQNPYNVASAADATEIEEAAADMFLNWVYRKQAEGGFLNYRWVNAGGEVCYPNGCPDGGRFTGAVRMDWMDDALSAIFTQHNW
jgi:hypothetical protein